MLKTLAAIAFCFVASLACAEESPEPYEIGGGWLTCPIGFLIHEGRCLRAHKGPVTEYGCMEYVCKGSGECEARSVAECGAVTAWVGNVGDFGAPVMSMVAPSAFVAPIVVGVSVAAPRGGRR